MSTKQERSSSKHKSRCLPTSKELNGVKDEFGEVVKSLHHDCKKELLRLKGGADGDGSPGLLMFILGCVVTLWVLIFLVAAAYALSGKA